MFRRLLLLGALATVCSTAAGCISEHTYGCGNMTLVAAGSPEGEIYTQHGAPDQVIEIGNPVGPDIKHWNKYLVVYRIAKGSKTVGPVMQEDAFWNIAYLVENGKVVNGGNVGGGTGSSILMPLSGAMHPRSRVGYGGDPGYPGSYGQTGRGGSALEGQNERVGY